MKKYLILMIMSLISLNVCAASKVQEFVDSLDHALEFGCDGKIVKDVFASRDDATIDMLESIISNYPMKDMFEFIIDDYIRQVKNPYAKYMIEVLDEEINITILDAALLDKAYTSYNERRYELDNSEDAKAFKSRLDSLIALLKKRGFKQTIPNHKLECVVVILEGDCPDCVACDLKHMGLK